MSIWHFFLQFLVLKFDDFFITYITDRSKKIPVKISMIFKYKMSNLVDQSRTIGFKKNIRTLRVKIFFFSNFVLFQLLRSKQLLSLQKNFSSIKKRETFFGVIKIFNPDILVIAVFRAALNDFISTRNLYARLFERVFSKKTFHVKVPGSILKH